MPLSPLAYVLIAGLVCAVVCGIFGLVSLAQHVAIQEAHLAEAEGSARESRIPTYSRTNHIGEN